MSLIVDSRDFFSDVIIGSRVFSVMSLLAVVFSSVMSLIVDSRVFFSDVTCS